MPIVQENPWPFLFRICHHVAFKLHVLFLLKVYHHFLDDSVLQGHSDVTGLSYSVGRKEGFLGIKVPRPSLGDREKSKVVD